MRDKIIEVLEKWGIKDELGFRYKLTTALLEVVDGCDTYWKEKCEILEKEREEWWSKSKTPDELFVPIDSIRICPECDYTDPESCKTCKGKGWVSDGS